jgi:ribonuclease G
MPSKELVISQNRHETKVAILEDGQLVEMFFQRANEYSLAGSIHKGRVTRVLPGMQSAFVDLGLERDCFLYVSDFFEEHADEFDRVDDRGRDARGRDRDRLREPREASPVLALPPVANGEQKNEGFKPVASVSAPEEGIAPAPTDNAGPADGSTSGPAEGTGDPHRDRRGRRSRRRRRGSHGFPESKYASPAEESAVVAKSEGDAGGEANVEVEEVGVESAAPAVAPPPPTEQFLLLPGESLAKYRRHAPPAASTPAPSSLEVQEMEPLAEDEAGADDAAEAILDRVDEMEERADAAASQPPEDDTLLPEEATEEAEADAQADTKPQADSKVESNPEPARSEPAVEAASASLIAELPVSELKAEKPAKAPSLETAEQPSTPGEDSAPSAPSKAQPAARAAGQGAAEENCPACPAEADHTVADAAEAEDVVGEAAHQGSTEPESGDLPEGIAVTPLSEAGGSSAASPTQSGRVAHRMSRRMRRKSRSQNQSQEGAGVEAQSETAVVPEAPVLETGAPETERTLERPERNNHERDNRGRDKDRDRDRDSDRDKDRDSDRDNDRDNDRDRERPPLPSISDLLKEGQEIIVQIAKEPLGQKGARITSHIALPGRYVVYMPTVEHLGVSRKIGSDEERLRLKKILQKNREGIAGGFIMRTAGEGRTEDEISADIQYLSSLWLDIRQKAEKRRAPLLLHHDVEVVQRLLRDQLTEGFKAVWVDNEDLYEQVLHAVERIAPQMLARVKLYTRPEPIFDAFGITQELEKALRPKVWLKSGGYIVINQTEALVAIDVNTGKYVGKSNRLEDTIVKTNVEAVKEIVRQMRLRDLGGIIVVDFIDMDERKNRTKVMTALEEAMRSDKAPYKILQFNDFGLVAITRKRVKQSLERALCSHCPYCEGAGYVKSVSTVISEILVEAQKYSKVVDGKECVLRASPEVAKEMKSVENKYLEEIEEILGRPLLVVADELLHQDKFDLT